MAVHALAVAPWLFACVAEPSFGPPGQNMTGAVTTVSTSNHQDTSGETGSPNDSPGCDPLADPVAECGPDMACDLTSNTCATATGDAAEDDLCTSTSDCVAGLVCVGGRCRAMCDATTGEGCAADRLCVVAADPIPGLCLVPCELAFGVCNLPGDACKRVIVLDGEVDSACVSNPGFGANGDACLSDPDCAPGYLCTEAGLHTLPCANEAASCCAPVCDTLELPCFGTEPACYLLGIPGQDNTGFCGVD
jgi:hypothetical protein